MHGRRFGLHLTRMKCSVVIAVLCIAVCAGLPNYRRKVAERIVGGVETRPHEFPFAVSVQYFGSHVCGGSVIRENAILTAAHCAEVGPPSSLTVKAGKHNIREDESTEQLRNVVSVHVHPNYNPSIGFQNDIAILRLNDEFVYNAAVLPIPLALSNFTAQGNSIVMGWGRLEESGSYPDSLQKTTIPIIQDTACRQQLGSDFVDNVMLCAGVPEGGKDTCAGDSGGALVANNVGYNYLAGISSWGIGCGRPNTPGAYTEVAPFYDYILSVVSTFKS